jgi:hypothetical protein
MSNGGACCLHGICCPPRADGTPDTRQVDALANWMRSHAAND